MEQKAPAAGGATVTTALPRRLRLLRQDAKMTLAQVAEKTGLSLSFLSDVETGRTDPSMETLRKLATAYGRRIWVSVEPGEQRGGD